ncbi:response regulator transcription factor [Mucilaginibacter gynuensis]|uniref:Response regulator transcription factor n=1 Tax=Mucilaginibacter gynuensis TaxID=1302236 RepID=A0ABP8FW22_9SPHI
MKVLFVEDEPVLMEEMVNYFSSFGHLCESAANYSLASDKIETYDYDIVVVDLNLPDGSGMRLIPPITNKTSETGIIILTANDSLQGKLEGLNLGADDYLTKPFYVEELNARINAIYRRKLLKGVENLKFDDFVIDSQLKTLFYKSSEVALTKKEYQLLVYFVVNKNRVVSKSSIAEHIWGDHIDESDNFDAVYVHLTNLRKKLNKAAGKDYIKTAYGVGYHFVTL